MVLVADVSHQDRALRRFDRAGDRHAGRGQELQGLPFAVHPDPSLELAAESGALLEGDADPPLLDPFPVAIEGLIAESRRSSG